MKKNHNVSKAELIRKAQDYKTRVSYRANLLCTLAILWDCFDFSEEDISEFVDKYSDLLESYNNGNEDLEQIAKNLEELTGVKIEITQ